MFISHISGGFTVEGLGVMGRVDTIHAIDT